MTVYRSNAFQQALAFLKSMIDVTIPVDLIRQVGSIQIQGQPFLYPEIDQPVLIGDQQTGALGRQHRFESANDYTDHLVGQIIQLDLDIANTDLSIRRHQGAATDHTYAISVLGHGRIQGVFDISAIFRLEASVQCRDDNTGLLFLKNSEHGLYLIAPLSAEILLRQPATLNSLDKPGIIPRFSQGELPLLIRYGANLPTGLAIP